MDETAIVCDHQIGQMKYWYLVGLTRTIYHCSQCSAVAVSINKDDLKWFNTFEALREYLQETEGKPVPA